MALCQEANGDNLGKSFLILYKIISCCVYSLDSLDEYT